MYVDHMLGLNVQDKFHWTNLRQIRVHGGGIMV